MGDHWMHRSIRPTKPANKQFAVSFTAADGSKLTQNMIAANEDEVRESFGRLHPGSQIENVERIV